MEVANLAICHSFERRRANDEIVVSFIVLLRRSQQCSLSQFDIVITYDGQFQDFQAVGRMKHCSWCGILRFSRLKQWIFFEFPNEILH